LPLLCYFDNGARNQVEEAGANSDVILIQVGSKSNEIGMVLGQGEMKAVCKAWDDSRVPWHYLWSGQKSEVSFCAVVIDT
jgi:hypothetical protein